MDGQNMKTENDFNAYLSKELKKFSPAVHTLKVSDKFTAGISDFLIFCNAQSLALESKFILELPTRGTTKILSHPFSGAQVTFLESLELTRNKGYGLIAVDNEKKFYLIHFSLIPADGNFTREQFESIPKKGFDYRDTKGFIYEIFGALF